MDVMPVIERDDDFVCPACGHMKDTPMHELGCIDKQSLVICPVEDDPDEWEHFEARDAR